MPKQICMRINKNGTQTVKEFKTEDNVIFDGKARIKFTPSCVFPPAKESGAGGFFAKFKFWNWFKSKKAFILFIEGALHALEFKEGDPNLLQTHWNQKEARAFVHKMVVLESMSVKPLKLYQFVILLAVNMAAVAGIIYIAMKFAQLG